MLLTRQQDQKGEVVTDKLQPLCKGLRQLRNEQGTANLANNGSFLEVGACQ